MDGSQNAVVSYTYTDYGETAESQGGSFNNEIRFAGGVYDEITGLYYLNARFYDPAVGRFLNPDSYRGEPVDPQTLHLYVYCANNPVNLVDPTGYAAETVVDVVFLGISYAEFVAAPSVTTFIYLVWDGVATVTPFVPGSYVAKGAKVLSKAGIVDNIASHGLRNLVEKGFSNAAQSASNKSIRKTTNKAQYKKAVNTVKEINTGKWNKGSFNSALDSIKKHYEKHGKEVGAKSIEEYLRKAEEFAKTAKKGASKSKVPGKVDGVVRYKKNGKYIDLAPDGTIISFGKQ